MLVLAGGIPAGQYDTVSKEIRVVIANSARAMRDMLFDTIRREGHFAVVAEVSSEETIADICELERANCVVVPLEEGRAPIELCRGMLEKRRDMKVIAVAETSEITALCWWSNGDVRCAYMKSSRENLVKALAYRVS